MAKQSGQRRGATSTLLRDSALAPVRRSSRPPGTGAAGRLDALIVLVAVDETDLWAQLPEPSRWRSMHGWARPAALKWRSSTLGNTRQTQIVLGYAKSGASPFERLNFAGQLVNALSSRQPRRVGVLVSPGLAEPGAWCEALLSALWSRSVPLPQFRSSRTDTWRLEAIDLYQAPRLDLARTEASARAGNRVRALTAAPPNRLDATFYRQLLARFARRSGLEFRWYSESDLRRAGAGAFLAVARANAARTAGIAHLRWRGSNRRSARRPDVALVGKGILFDTGGINLKPHRYMLDMHTDMSGSAVALASLLALAELDSPLSVDAWLAITENNIGPDAYRPQEIVTAANGTTIQVIHSDAEGRMVLADTLTLAARTRPSVIIDFATLTGACVHALTERYSGVFTNRPELAAELVAAGRDSGERVWNFPLDEDFDSDIESPVADVMQCAADGKGDHILAARFLQRFVEGRPWVHVDLSSAQRRGGLGHVGTDITGFGVRWTLELLLSGRLLRAVA